MKVLISKEALFDGLNTVSRAISTRSAIQSLSGVLIKTMDESLELSATDMEIGLRLNASAQIERSGVVVVPGRLFLDVVRSLPSGMILLNTDGEDLQLESGASKFRLKLYPEDEFPKLPQSVEGELIDLSTRQLTETIQRVVKSASKDEARPVLTGVLISSECNRLVMVATDSYRLSVMETEVEDSVVGSLKVNVPARAMQELLRIASSVEEESVSVGISGSQVVFKIGGVTLSSRLIEGQFPNYKQLIPESFDHKIIFDGSEFLEVVRRVGLMAQKNSPLKVSVEAGKVTVTASTSDIGEAVESMPVRYGGDELEIGFNPEFLRDGLESSGGGETEISLISALRPGLIRAPGNKSFSYLIMPVRLNV